jgi:cell division transport system permease protein
MLLVGATRWFIRWPFILEGVIYGFSGSIVAVIILTLIYSYVSASILSSLPFIPMIPGLSLWTAVFLVFVGPVIGFLASLFSLSKFLKV